jgi:hypothetical protein
MAIVTRYFAASAAGDGTGSSWANRAALIATGAWSTVITGFDFSGADSLVCYVQGASYTAPSILQSSSFSVAAPTLLNPLIIRACDGSGAAWVPPDPDWVSPQAAWSTTGMVVLDFSSDKYINLNYASLLGVKCTGSRNGYIYASIGGVMDWCIIENTGAGTSGTTASTYLSASNSVFKCTNGFSYITATAAELYNVRLEGPGASSGSGNRDGISTSGVINFTRVAVVGCAGAGIKLSTTTVARSVMILGCTVANCGGVGIDLDLTSGTSTVVQAVSHCVVTGCSAGVDANDNMSVVVSSCRLRDNTSGNVVNARNYPTDLNNYVTDSDDATEYVDATNGDYRIKATSAIWGKGYGAGDEIPTAASIAAAVWAREGRSLTA